MAELKTKKNDASVEQFLDTVVDTQKREDCHTLLRIFEEATGEKASMWGESIVGFGQYHYKSERSTQEGDWMMTGFSPRAQNITMYITPGFANYQDLLKKLGKHKVSKGACIYIKKLSDIDVEVLKEIIRDAMAEMRRRYG